MAVLCKIFDFQPPTRGHYVPLSFSLCKLGYSPIVNVVRRMDKESKPYL